MNVRSYPPRWNAAPSQDLLVIRRNHRTGEVSLDPLRWGLIPHWCNDPTGGRKPINAKCETVRTLPTFRDAYRLRRCIVPVDGFFEWKAIKGQKAKQPYAIAMKDAKPFGIGGIWENWKDPASGASIRTLAIITTDANALVADIHDRMPLILAPETYERWLGDEPDPGDLMGRFPSELMRMWPISTRVNKPENDDPSVVGPVWNWLARASSPGPQLLLPMQKFKHMAISHIQCRHSDVRVTAAAAHSLLCLRQGTGNRCCVLEKLGGAPCRAGNQSC
jgi:putative SOS response-associated peptidase YedK